MRRSTAAVAILAGLISVPAALAETYQIEGTFERGDPISDEGDPDGSYIDGYNFYARGGEIEFLIQGYTFLPGLMIKDSEGTVLFKSLGSAIDSALGYRWTVPAAGDYSLYVFQSYPVVGKYTFTVTELD